MITGTLKKKHPFSYVVDHVICKNLRLLVMQTRIYSCQRHFHEYKPLGYGKFLSSHFQKSFSFFSPVWLINICSIILRKVLFSETLEVVSLCEDPFHSILYKLTKFYLDHHLLFHHNYEYMNIVTIIVKYYGGNKAKQTTCKPTSCRCNNTLWFTIVFYFSMVFGFKPMTSPVIGKCYITVTHSQPLKSSGFGSGAGHAS